MPVDAAVGAAAAAAAAAGGVAEPTGEAGAPPTDHGQQQQGRFRREAEVRDLVARRRAHADLWDGYCCRMHYGGIPLYVWLVFGASFWLAKNLSPDPNNPSDESCRIVLALTLMAWMAGCYNRCGLGERWAREDEEIRARWASENADADYEGAGQLFAIVFERIRDLPVSPATQSRVGMLLALISFIRDPDTTAVQLREAKGVFVSGVMVLVEELRNGELLRMEEQAIFMQILMMRMQMRNEVSPEQQAAREEQRHEWIAKLRTAQHDPSAEEEEDTCAICQEQFNPGDALLLIGCGHRFHTPCAEKWLVLNPTCPLCKVSINPESAEDAV
jgi:hypothetical protein